MYRKGWEGFAKEKGNLEFEVDQFLAGNGILAGLREDSKLGVA